ncbi:unnamed protein product [Cochlearia groenlandica]
MGKKTFSSDLVHLLFVLLLLCTLLCRTESAFTSHDESLSLSLTARRLMSGIDVGASSSGQGGGRNN